MRSARTPRAIRWGVVSEPKVTGTIIDGAPARLSCLYPADRLNSTPGQSSKGATHARARRTENESGAAPHPAGGRPSGVGRGGTLAGGRHPVRHTSGSRTLSMVRRNPRRGPSAESAHAGLGAQVARPRFGEISMMVLNPATATVVTRTPVRAYVMSHLQFLEVRVHQTVMLQLRSAMGDRLSADRKLV